MSKRRDPNPEFDLFIPALGDLPLKDQREVMERPFFSLQKRKRLKPIEYRSPDGDAWVRVQAIPDYGMATIWDADILIWAASTLNRMKQQGLNDLPRTLTTTPYDLLRAIKRSTGAGTTRSCKPRFSGYRRLRSRLRSARRSAGRRPASTGSTAGPSTPTPRRSSRAA
ncbi:plasmid replication initiator protein-like protein (plasmid) [Sphingobium cloacae]|uniref:Plasmid replication initiator protein-like protein n=1 Tax=Sphingobium cloacae TaxID=120107 RepID=A0A1E1F945_9SPHN|nr:plasmid replication initiator protein-like protein [Sphingobium cloacae]